MISQPYKIMLDWLADLFKQPVGLTDVNNFVSRSNVHIILLILNINQSNFWRLSACFSSPLAPGRKDMCRLLGIIDASKRKASTFRGAQRGNRGVLTSANFFSVNQNAGVTAYGNAKNRACVNIFADIRSNCINAPILLFSRNSFCFARRSGTRNS